MAIPAGKQQSESGSQVQQPAGPTEITHNEATLLPAVTPLAALARLAVGQQQQHVQRLGREKGNQFVLRYLAGRAASQPGTLARSEDAAPATDETPAPATDEAPAPATDETPAPATDEPPLPDSPATGDEPAETAEEGATETPAVDEAPDNTPEEAEGETPVETEPPAPVPELSDGVVVDKIAVGALMETILASSAYLKPYVGDKLKGKAIGNPEKLTIHKSDNRFEYKYMELADKWALRDTDKGKQELASKHGFYHRESDTIHLRPSSTNQEMLHEAIHKLADGHFTVFGKFVNEGATQYVTKRVIEEMGQTANADIYPDEVAFAEKLIAFLTEPIALEHYFNQHDVTELLALVKVSLRDYQANYQGNDEQKEAFRAYLLTII